MIEFVPHLPARIFKRNPFYGVVAIGASGQKLCFTRKTAKKVMNEHLKELEHRVINGEGRPGIILKGILNS